MTIWSLGKSQPSWGFPDHFVGASAMLQRGRPPVPFDVPGALTDDGTSPLWESIGRMFCHDPRDRPTISNIRNELIHGGLLPLPPSKAWGSLCLPQHLYVHHFEYLTRISRASMRSVRRALDNTRLFRSTLLLLPRIELAHVAEALQMVSPVPTEGAQFILAFEITDNYLLSASISALLVGMPKARGSNFCRTSAHFLVNLPIHTGLTMFLREGEYPEEVKPPYIEELTEITTS